MNRKERKIAYLNLSQACEWEGKKIARVFCEALTDSNFHTARKELVPHINKIFGMRIPRMG